MMVPGGRCCWGNSGTPCHLWLLALQGWENPNCPNFLSLAGPLEIKSLWACLISPFPSLFLSVFYHYLFTAGLRHAPWRSWVQNLLATLGVSGRKLKVWTDLQLQALVPRIGLLWSIKFPGSERIIIKVRGAMLWSSICRRVYLPTAPE